MKLAPELSELTYEEQLSRLELPTLKQRRERGDLLTIYRIMKNMEILDREDLLIWDTRNTRGHGKKTEKGQLQKRCEEEQLPPQSSGCVEQSG